jgi:hypothetical protein
MELKNRCLKDCFNEQALNKQMLKNSWRKKKGGDQG